MSLLGTGLSEVGHYEDALCVQTAELSVLQRHGAWETSILTTQGNLAITYGKLGQFEQALSIEKDVYFGHLKLYGEENATTLLGANNYATALFDLQLFDQVRGLLLKVMPVARRVLGASHEYTLKMRKMYAITLAEDPAATVDDLSEAVTTLEEADRTARRVFGGAHPITTGIEINLREARAALAPREGDVESLRAAVEAMAPGDA